MMGTVTGKVRAIPPVGWVALLALAGVAYLMWHNYCRDDHDTDWTTPKETQPPSSVALQIRPMDSGPAFRSRRYPGTLADSHTSIIGEF